MEKEEREEHIRLINCEMMEMDCEIHGESAATDVYEREEGGLNIEVSNCCCIDFKVKLFGVALKRLDEKHFPVKGLLTLTNRIHLG